MPSSSESSGVTSSERHAKFAWILATAIGLVLCGVALLAPRFAYGTDVNERPVMSVVLLLAGATVLYLVAARLVTQIQEDRNLLHLVWIPAILYRLLLLPTDPILEVDLYRYMWDGISICEGVTPYRFSPQQVLDASETSVGDLGALTSVRDRSSSVRTILGRVHFSELRTVYPPTSQIVFAIPMWLTPEGASVKVHVVAMKATLILLDLVTMFLVWRMLPIVGLHRGWTILYGWCPLLLKEVANSGHLDAIAVCLTTAAVFFLVKTAKQPSNRYGLVFSALYLALGTAAKLYPVVLVPLLFFAALRIRSLAIATASVVVYMAFTAFLMYPMLGQQIATEIDATAIEQDLPNLPTMPAGDGPTADDFDFSSPPVPEPFKEDVAPSGLTEFLSRWEMNDFIFALMLENTRPTRPGTEASWFAFVPQTTRAMFSGQFAELLSVDRQKAAFMFTRAITLLIAGIIALALAFRVNVYQPRSIMAAAALTIAWFFLLAPTLNPWYWTWVLPFVAAVRNRAWLVVPGILLVYYLRFWCEYEQRYLVIGKQRFTGNALFDNVIVFAEWTPFFALLVLFAFLHWRSNRNLSSCR